MWQSGRTSSWGGPRDRPLADCTIKPKAVASRAAQCSQASLKAFYNYVVSTPGGVPTWTFYTPGSTFTPQLFLPPSKVRLRNGFAERKNTL